MNTKGVEDGMGERVPAYKDSNHPSNQIRPKVKCWGCGRQGCVGKYWGNWCFECNVRRIDGISKTLENMESLESYTARHAAAAPEAQPSAPVESPTCDCIANFCTNVLNNNPLCKLKRKAESPKFVEAGGIFAEVKALRDATWFTRCDHGVGFPGDCDKCLTEPHRGECGTCGTTWTTREPVIACPICPQPPESLQEDGGGTPATGVQERTLRPRAPLVAGERLLASVPPIIWPEERTPAVLKAHIQSEPVADGGGLPPLPENIEGLRLDSYLGMCLEIREHQLASSQEALRLAGEENERQQRTMKFWEESYLKEHEHWGDCKFRLVAEAQSERMQQAAEKLSGVGPNIMQQASLNRFNEALAILSPER